MPVITLPDGSQKKFDTASHRSRSGGQHRCGPGQGGHRRPCERQAGGHVFRHQRRRPALDRDGEGSGGARRHPSFHRAPARQAVQAIYPKAQVTIGPVIEDGFFYDFAFERPFTPEDLEKIEAKMKEIAAADLKVTRRVMERDAAVKLFESMGEKYKAEIIASIPSNEDIGALRPGRVVRPVPRSARAIHGQAQGLQVDEGGRRLLARRPAQRDAPAHLRHRVAQRQGSGGLPASPRGGRKARPPPHRQGTRSLPLPGRGAGRGVLASQGLAHFPAAHQLHAQAPGRSRATAR